MVGDELLDTFLAATGLPEQRVKEELLKLIAERNLNPQTLTLNELRSLMVEYLQREILAARSYYGT